jgi:hypothetical protein
MTQRPISEMTDAELLVEAQSLKRELLRLSAEGQDSLNRIGGYENCVRFYGEPGSLKLADSNKIHGYASLWGVVDLHKDVVLPGAFSKSLARHRSNGTRPLMLWQHMADEIVGTWDEVREDSKGLFVSPHTVFQFTGAHGICQNQISLNWFVKSKRQEVVDLA